MTTLVREPSKQAPGIDQFARKALVGIVVAALIHPAYFTFTRTGGAMYGYSGILAASLSLMALGAMALKSSLVPPSFLLIAASCSIYYLASLLAGKPLQDPSELISILGLSALMIIAWKHSPDTLLQPICIVLGTYLIINFVTIVTHPAGLYFAYYADTKNGIANWFLGYKNPLIRLAIPTLALWYLRDTLIFGVIRARSKLLTVLVLVSVIRVNSTNGVVALLLFVLLTYALVSRKSALPARLRIYMATSAVFFVLIVILRVQNLFSWLLVDYLHKDLTLVGRTYIWDAALTNFFDSPWIGTGSTSLQISASGAFGSMVTHPHNLVLYVLMKGGLVGFAIFAALLIRASRQAVLSVNSQASGVVAIGVGALLIVGMTESLTETVLFLPLVLMIDLLRSDVYTDRPLDKVRQP